MTRTQIPLYDNHLWLFHHYIILKKSIKKIAKECGVSEGLISRRIKFFKIPKRTKSEYLKLAGNEKIKEVKLI